MKGLRRSFQFVPANNPGMVQSADILGADSIIFDIEDAVAISEKDSARDLLAEALKSLDYSTIEVLVRVNPIDTPFFKEDINALKNLPVDGYLIPKATLDSMKDSIKAIEEAGINSSILPLVETAMGLEEVFEITNLSDKIDGVLLGGEDLSLDLGVTRTKEGNEISYARARVVS
ncbi:MAG: aldolase/citrate lyase family protein, partial [Clostridiaceae bacterium]